MQVTVYNVDESDAFVTKAPSFRELISCALLHLRIFLQDNIMAADFPGCYLFQTKQTVDRCTPRLKFAPSPYFALCLPSHFPGWGRPDNSRQGHSGYICKHPAS